MEFTNMSQTFGIKINGVVVHKSIPSRMLAESLLSSLPVDQRAVAEIVILTPDGKTALFG